MSQTTVENEAESPAEAPKREKLHGRPPGLPRTGGRVKGTPNKRTAKVHEILLALKCDPITGMARLAMNEKNPPELRARMYSELAQYIAPKRKAVEVTGNNDGPIETVHTERNPEATARAWGSVGDAVLKRVPNLPELLKQ